MRSIRFLSAVVLLRLFALGRPATAEQELPGQLEVRYRTGRIEIEFTAPVDPTAVASSLEVDGKPQRWELLPDGRTLRLAESLPPQRHWVGITPWAVKPPALAGRYRKAYVVDASRGDHVTWSLRDANDLRLAQEEASLDEDGVSYHYDAANNLLASSTRSRGVESTRAFPLDGSGRNRPSEVNGTPLEWDANGNLKRKGDLTFAYDAHNRPVAVHLAGAEGVRFDYDSFNRLVRTTYGDGRVYEKTWDGWNDVETHANDQLVSRRIYGQGLDDLVRQDIDLDGDGALESTQYPIRDSSHNIVVLTDGQGRTIERYDYTPFGQQTIRVDTAPPRVDSVAIVLGVVEVVFSEAIDLRRALAGAHDGKISLYTTTGPLPFEAARGQGQGRNASRRLFLEPVDPIAAETSIQLRLEPEAVVDLFQKPMAEAYERTFAWAEDRIVHDTTPPQLLEVRLRASKLEFDFTERLDPSQATTATTLDDQPVPLVASSDGLTLLAATALPTGTHHLKVATTLTDFAGNHLEAAFDQTLTIGAGDPNRLVYQAPDPEVLQASAAGNAYGFQGREKEPLTGWIYLRNRWYDPELGRFVSTDPLGYADGPNVYAYARNNPVNRGDALGLFATDFHYGMTMYLALRAGFDFESARRLASGAQAPDVGWRNPFRRFGPAALGSLEDCLALEEWHFPGAQDAEGEVLPGGAAAWSKIDDGLVSGNVTQFAEGLHPLQDSWAHRGKPGIPTLPSLGYRTLLSTPALPGQPSRPLVAIPWLTPGKPCSGHAWSKWSPALPLADKPAFFDEDALDAAEATYLALLKLQAFHPAALRVVQAPKPWDSVKEEIRPVLGASTALRIKWLRSRGIELPE